MLDFKNPIVMKKVSRIVFIALAVILAFFGFKKIKVNKS